MTDSYKQFEQRKRDHIQLALREENQARELNRLDELCLQHEAIPDVDFKDVNISSLRFAEEVPTPFVVASMTAGHEDARKINFNLLKACTYTGWAMGVGSQRRELTDDYAAFDWTELRQEFQEVNLFSNIGISQIINTPIEKIKKLVSAINAQALIVHCNPLQECIQPEGTPSFKGALNALSVLADNIDVPIVVKETGCGFSVDTLLKLNEINIQAVDVSGSGGTHWGRIEGQRSTDGTFGQLAAGTFRNWGIDTVQSIKNARMINPQFEIWGSGGVRNGLQAAKLLALGASSIAIAKPLLEAALKSSDEVLRIMQLFEYELKVAMFCTGSANVSDLKEKLCP